MDEFELIDRYFSHHRSRADVLVGVGDDAALIKLDPATPVITAIATLSAPSGNCPDGAALARALTRKAFNRLAVHGGCPAWITLALTLKEADDDWLQSFSAALAAAMAPYDAALVGGDTTRGPITATLVAHGPAPSKKREGATPPRAGDAIYVTGDLGHPVTEEDPNGEFCDPKPARVREAVAAWPFTAAAGDLRESLAATLLRLTEPHKLGVEIESARLPISAACGGKLDRPGGARIIVDASADVELCFIVGAAFKAPFEDAMQGFQLPCTRIGRVVDKTGVHLR